MVTFLPSVCILINVNVFVGNAWKTRGKVGDFDKDWRMAILSVGRTFPVL